MSNRNKGVGAALAVVVIAILVGVGWYAYNQNNKNDGMNEPGSPALEQVDTNDVNEPVEDSFQISGKLVDVTNGKTLLGTVFSGNSIGVAKAKFVDEKYTVVANFENLPDPAGDVFYEGWVVDRSSSSVVSSGKLEKVDGKFVNEYSSSKDLISNTFYVLTIEPNDGDPAPADHVLEGLKTAI